MPEQPSWIVKIPPPMWTLALLIAAYASYRSFGWASVVVLRSTAAAVVLAVVGVALAIWAERTFAAAGTEIMPASLSNKALVTSGPFRVTRNPMYASILLATLGVAFYFGTLVFLAVPVFVFLLTNFIVIPFEERKMQRQFGDQYREYCTSVRRWV